MLRRLAEVTDDEILVAPAISVIIGDGQPVCIFPPAAPSAPPVSDAPFWMLPVIQPKKTAGCATGR